jgi:hypothetical protein
MGVTRFRRAWLAAVKVGGPWRLPARGLAAVGSAAVLAALFGALSTPLLVGRDELIRDFSDALDDGPGGPARATLYTGARGLGSHCTSVVAS